MNHHALSVANLLERIGHLSRTDEKTGDLYPAQWAALRYLAQANRYSRTPMALARYLCSSRGTTSQTLIALERKGYITRKPSERDKRGIDIDLTQKGRSILEDDPVLRLVATIKSTAEKESGALHAHLARILESLVEANDGRRFGECKTCRHFQPNAGSSGKTPHFCGLLEVGLSDADSEKICVEQE